MLFTRAVATLAGVIAFTTPSLADVLMITRHSELRDSYSNIAPLPPSYSDIASTDAFGPVTLTTPHGASFTSSVSSTAITAQLHGGGQYGGRIDPFSSGTSTTFDVVFQVTNTPVGISILLNGSSFPIGNTRLRLFDNATNQLIFDSDSNVVITGGIPQGNWNNALWTSTLAPGTYRVSGYANGQQTYSAGGGSGGGGSGSMNVQITFTPTPGAAALALLAPIATRRRRA